MIWLVGMPSRIGKRKRSGLPLLYGLFLSVSVPHMPRMRNISLHFSFLMRGMRLKSFPFMS